MKNTCQHCRNGWFPPNGGGHYFGTDVECVNGVLIDIDVAHEGWERDVAYPVAPCHPMWARQKDGDEAFLNDCQERLAEWAELAASAIEAGTAETPESGSVHESAAPKEDAQ